MLGLGLRALLRRRQPEISMPAALEGAAGERFWVRRRRALGLASALLVTGALVVWRGGRRDNKPRYIGTPGVESASGRDRVRSGELPPEYGTERGRRSEGSETFWASDA